jgi:hypothetical protein
MTIAGLRTCERPTAWLGREDSNSEMSPQIIPLKVAQICGYSAEFWPLRLFAFELRRWGNAARVVSSPLPEGLTALLRRWDAHARSRRLRCRSGSTHTIRASCCITWRRRISAWAITAPPRTPGTDSSRMMLAACYGHLGRVEEARAEATPRAHALDPNFAQGHSATGLALMYAGRAASHSTISRL